MSTIGYTNYTNIGDHFYMRGYKPGDRLVRGYSGEVDADRAALDTDWLLEAIFSKHNRDDRPDGRLCPSMSVGDVIVLGETAYTVESIGFTPVNLDPRDLITDKTWTEVR